MLDFFRMYASLETIVDSRAAINPHKNPKIIKKKISAVSFKGSSFSDTNRFIFLEAALNVLEKIMHNVAQKKALTRFLTRYILDVTSMLKITPPKGDPNAKVIPAAAAAEIIAFFEVFEELIFENSLIFKSLLQTVADMCTKGPTLPLEAPLFLNFFYFKKLNKKYLFLIKK